MEKLRTKGSKKKSLRSFDNSVLNKFLLVVVFEGFMTVKWNFAGDFFGLAFDVLR